MLWFFIVQPINPREFTNASRAPVLGTAGGRWGRERPGSRSPLQTVLSRIFFWTKATWIKLRAYRRNQLTRGPLREFEGEEFGYLESKQLSHSFQSSCKAPGTSWTGTHRPIWAAKNFCCLGHKLDYISDLKRTLRYRSAHRRTLVQSWKNTSRGTLRWVKG